MSKKNGYVCLDKNLMQYLPSIDREYSLIEALFSYTLDQDNGKSGTISGYSKLWSWSRNRVRNLLNSIDSQTGHYPDRKQTQTRHPVYLIDVGLRHKPDTNPTQTRQDPDTTIEPKPKPKDIYIPEYKEIIQYLNTKSGRKFKHNTSGTKTKIKARYEEGFSLDDFKRVIRTKCDKWLNSEKYEMYLRPETLFGNKFESYLNEPEPKPKAKLQLIPGAVEKAQHQIEEFHHNG